MQEGVGESRGSSTLCPTCRGWFSRSSRAHRFCSYSCRRRAEAWRLRYGLEPNDYHALVDRNQGRCPICQDPTTKWVIDHDHETGRVVGAVCNSCNTGAIAGTYHDPDLVGRLLDYVTHSPAEEMGVKAFVKQTRPHGWRVR